jgi:hypothetical protein
MHMHMHMHIRMNRLPCQVSAKRKRAALLITSTHTHTRTHTCLHAHAHIIPNKVKPMQRDNEELRPSLAHIHPNSHAHAHIFHSSMLYILHTHTHNLTPGQVAAKRKRGAALITSTSWWRQQLPRDRAWGQLYAPGRQ